MPTASKGINIDNMYFGFGYFCDASAHLHVATSQTRVK